MKSVFSFSRFSMFAALRMPAGLARCLLCRNLLTRGRNIEEKPIVLLRVGVCA